MLTKRYLDINSQQNIVNAQAREMVLLRGTPCNYGKCAFCDYHLDNVGFTVQEMIKFNEKELEHVTGKYKILEIINSGSVFELPSATLDKIFEVCREYHIHTLYFEAFLSYSEELDGLKERFLKINTEVKFRLGVESFDEAFRMNFLNKKIKNVDIFKEANRYESACLLIGVENQNSDMIKKDIALGLEFFNRLTLNVFVENTTHIKENKEVIEWFKEYSKSLEGNSRVEIFLNNLIF